MTTYNTGNPIGSTDSRDRLDNTENMDYLENSTTELTHADRLGTVRKTRHGMEVEHDAQIAAHETEHDAQMQSFENDFDGRLAGMAFTRVGSFTTGATLTDMRQVLIWEVSQGGDGHEYGWTGSFSPSGKVVIAGSNPETTGGIGVGAWVDRTDVTLRSDINIVQKLFTCVADMVSDTSLTVGKIIETIGYYNGWAATVEGPKGGNHYEVVAGGTGVADGGAFITLANGLQAKGLFLDATVNVNQFGIKGDGVTDDTYPFQSSIYYAKKKGIKLKMNGKQTIRVTKSIDATSAYGDKSHSLYLVGDNQLDCILLGDLDEPYPILDLTNNCRGILDSVAIISSVSSLDTCSVLLAETFATGMNLFEISKCNISNKSLNARASVCAICTDQLRISNSSISMTGASASSAFTLAGSNVLDIASKHKDITIQGGDLTYFSAEKTNFSCDGGYSIDLRDYSNVSLDNCYFANIGTRSPTALVRLASNSRTMQPNFTNCRSEMQGIDNGINVFDIVDAVYNGIFSGTLGMPNGGTFSGGGKMFNCQAKLVSGVKLFNGIGALIGCDFSLHSGANSIGTIDPAAVALSSNISFTGRSDTLPNILSVFATVPGLKIHSLSNEINTPSSSTVRESIMNRVLFPRADTPQGYRSGFSGGSSSVPVVAYTGGSGLQKVATVSVPTSVLAYVAVGTGASVLPYLDVEIWGDGTFGSDSTLSVSLVQGENTAALCSLTTIPSGTRGFHIVIRIHATSTSGNLLCMTDATSAPLVAGSVISTSKYTNLDAAKITRNSLSPLEFNISVSSPTSSPISHMLSVVKG